MKKKKSTASRNTPRQHQTRSQPHVAKHPIAVERLTVAWMVCLMATLGAETVSLVAWGIQRAGGVESPSPIAVLAELMLMIAGLSGVATLTLTGTVLRWRIPPPPRVITIAALLAGIVPWCVILVLLLGG